MSTATAFKYFRPFPFCPDEAAAPGAGFDYVAFATSGTDPSGSPGLTSAMQFYWNLENIEITPVGSFSNGAYSAVFDRSLKFFLPDTDAPGFLYNSFGFASPDFSPPDPDEPARQPRERVCLSITEPQSQFGQNLYSDTNYDHEMAAQFMISFHSGEWRLYYVFNFQVENLDQEPNPLNQAFGLITNPSNTVIGGTLVDSGTFGLLGLTLGWEAYQIYGDAYSGLGLSGSSEFFTY